MFGLEEQPSPKRSMNRSSLRRGLFLIPLVLACFTLSLPRAQAIKPPSDGGYANGNTAEGTNALFSLTSGLNNTAMGFEALYHNTTGSDNTANGVQALFYNPNGYNNTANGVQALFHNTTGYNNTANGGNALFSNTTGDHNTANGVNALFSNTTGSQDTADGVQALLNNTTGNNNSATGDQALFHNTTGSDNTANGVQALFYNTIGDNNIGLGSSGGSNLTTGSNNIDIGNAGVAGESSTIRIGTSGTQTKTVVAGIIGVTVVKGVGVVIDSNGQLGTKGSSERFKEAIKPMDKASEAILALKPVTFHYKKKLDPDGIPQFGLVAEEVAKVDPDLVVRDEKGKMYTVRYDAVNAMLLNEFLKQHRKVEEQEATIAQQRKDFQAALAQQRKDFETAVAQQQKGMEVFAATLKGQASQIQKVNAQLEVSIPTPQMILNNQ
jgi:hypothetical protein